MITCNADLSLLEMAFFFVFFFLCLLGVFSILAFDKTFGCLFSSRVDSG